MVTQQCRAEDLERVRATYEGAGIGAELAAFSPDVADRLRDAHLVIARAGASTVAELAVHRAAIDPLVPLPSAIDDHQSANARALADAGGAWVMPQPGFTVAALADRLTSLLADPSALAGAASGARLVARPGAADALADVVERVVREAEPSRGEPISRGETGGQTGGQPGGQSGRQTGGEARERSAAPLHRMVRRPGHLFQHVRR